MPLRGAVVCRGTVHRLRAERRLAPVVRVLTSIVSLPLPVCGPPGVGGRAAEHGGSLDTMDQQLKKMEQDCDRLNQELATLQSSIPVSKAVKSCVVAAVWLLVVAPAGRAVHRARATSMLFHGCGAQPGAVLYWAWCSALVCGVPPRALSPTLVAAVPRCGTWLRAQPRRVHRGTTRAVCGRLQA